MYICMNVIGFFLNTFILRYPYLYTVVAILFNNYIIAIMAQCILHLIDYYLTKIQKLLMFNNRHNKLFDLSSSVSFTFFFFIL